MANNYYKFYKLIEILHEETDEDHILTMPELLQRLEEKSGEKVDRRNVYEYIKVLKDLDFDISDYTENKKGYFLRHRTFEEHEIRILMDCIASCHFITHDKTKALLEKLVKLGSSFVVDRLKNQIYIDNRSKSINKEIFYNIDKINRAIVENKKISFYYCHYDTDKQLRPKMQVGCRKLYTVSPVFMILKEESYYLVSISDKYDNPTHYRMDRMQMITVLEEEHRRSSAEIEEFKDGLDTAAYTKKCFRMYSGKDCRVVIKLKNNLLDMVIDELGEDVEISQAEEGYFIATFTAKLSLGLKRWIMQLGSEGKVLEPEGLVEDIKAEVQRMREIYGICNFRLKE